MKFRDLNIGQRFLYQGKAMKKSGPLQAVESLTGTEKMIMRAALVERCPEAGVSNPDARHSPTGHSGKLERALASYHQTCLSLIANHEQDHARLALETAYNEILKVLEMLSPDDRKL